MASDAVLVDMAQLLYAALAFASIHCLSPSALVGQVIEDVNRLVTECAVEDARERAQAAHMSFPAGCAVMTQVPVLDCDMRVVVTCRRSVTRIGHRCHTGIC